MTPERWQQLKQIFQSALERNPADRSAFLSQASADDPALRDEVESLISSHDQAGDAIEAIAGEAATEMLASDEQGSIVGKRIGHYEVLSRMGTRSLQAKCTSAPYQSRQTIPRYGSTTCNYLVGPLL